MRKRCVSRAVWKCYAILYIVMRPGPRTHNKWLVFFFRGIRESRNKGVTSRSPCGKLDAGEGRRTNDVFFLRATTPVWVLTIVGVSLRRPSGFHARDTERIVFRPSANFSTRCTNRCSRLVRENGRIIVQILISHTWETKGSKSENNDFKNIHFNYFNEFYILHRSS